MYDLQATLIEHLQDCPVLEDDDMESDPSPVASNFQSSSQNMGSYNMGSAKDQYPKVACPVCGKLIPEPSINGHLDDCLSRIAIREAVSESLTESGLVI